MLADIILNALGLALSQEQMNSTTLFRHMLTRKTVVRILQGVWKRITNHLSEYNNTKTIINKLSDKRFVIGIITGLSIFGPAIAFTLGGVFSKMPVTLEGE